MEMTIGKRGNMSPDEIGRESRKIFKGHFSTFLSIQLTLVLPSVILTICYASLLLSYVPSEYFECFWEERAPVSISWNTLLELLPFLSVGVMSSVLLLAIYALSVAASICAVVLFFNDKAVSYSAVLKGVIPRLWMRLFATLLCWLMLLGPMILVSAGFHMSAVWSWVSLRTFTGTMPNTSTKYLIILTVVLVVVTLVVLIAKLVTALLFIYTLFFGWMTFTLVSGVCIFEENCGWATLRRTWQLVEGKRLRACEIYVRVFMVEYLVGCALSGGGPLVISDIFWVLNKLRPWSVLLVVTGVGWVTYRFQMACIAAAVTYVSFEAESSRI